MPETVSIHAQYAPISLNRTLFDARIANGGFFLGCSRDFWTVVTTCFLGMTFSFLLMYSCVAARTARMVSEAGASDICGMCQEDDSGEDSGDDEDMGKVEKGFIHVTDDEDIPEPVFSHGFMQRVVLRADLNSSFASAMDLSVRAALACAFCSLGYFSSTFSFLNSYGWSMQYVVVIITFTAYLSAGSTWSLACSGFVGTLLAVLNCLLMFFIYPDGVEEPRPGDTFSGAMIFGIINFLFFSVVLLALNFPTNARMFALSWQAYFTMCFLNPQSTVIYSTGLNEVSLYGAAIGPLMGTVWGIIFSILIPLVPRSLGFEVMSALATAQEVSFYVSWQESHIWNRLISSYSDGAAKFEQKAFGAELTALREKAKQIDGALADAWWECCDLGRCGRIRAYLGALKGLLVSQQMHVQQAFLAVDMAGRAEVEGETSRPDLILAVLPEIQKLSRCAWKLQCRCAIVAMSGTIDHEAQSSLKHAAAETAAAQERLAAALVVARKQSSEVLTQGMVTQNAFAHALSGFAQAAEDFAGILIEDDFPAGVGPIAGFIEGTKGLFSNCQAFSRDTSFVLRSGVGFLLAFHFGMTGISGLIPNWNSTPPGTIAYLLSSAGHGGSALKKNFDRFVGVGLGTMSGQFLYVVLAKVHDSAPNLNTAIGAIVFFCFELAALYVYFAGSSFSYVGLLIACFGAEHILLPYKDGGGLASSDRDSQVYINMMGQFIAIISAACMDNLGPRIVLFTFAGALATHGIGMKVESLLVVVLAIAAAVLLDKFASNIPGSVVAVDSFRRFQKCFHSTLVSVLELEDGEGSDNDDEDGDGAAILGCMMDEGREAAMEPRVNKTPWNEPLWAKLIESCQRLWTSVQALTAVVSGDLYGRLAQSSEALHIMSERLLERADETMSFAVEVMSHTTEEPVASELPATFEGDRRLLREKAVKSQNVIFEQAAAKLSAHGSGGQAVKSLLDDDVCTVSTVLLLLASLNRQLVGVQEALLQAPGVWKVK